MKILEYNYSTNLGVNATLHIPVSDFLRQNRNNIERAVGGLLDYGYDEWQIATILNTDTAKVRRIMRFRGYKMLDELNPREETE